MNLPFSVEKPLTDYFFLSLKRALENLRSAEILLRRGQFSSCISKAYFVAFHVARGLLALKEATDLEKHSEVRSLFNHCYVKSGEVEKYYAKALSELERERLAADYDVEYSFDRERAESELEKARKFFSLGLRFAKEISRKDREFLRDYLEIEKATSTSLTKEPNLSKRKSYL